MLLDRVTAAITVLAITGAAAGPGRDLRAAQENPLSKPSGSAAERTVESYPGLYEGREITVRLQLAGGEFRGALIFRGQSYPLEASRASDGVVGTFRVDDRSFGFRAAIDGKAMTLESGGSTYELEKKGADRDGAGKTIAKSKGNPLFRSGKVYKHRLGFTFRYPRDWSVREEAAVGGVLLTPPGQAMGLQGPEEYYILGGTPAPGIERSDDPQVVQHIDTFAASMLPFLRRTGKPQAIASGRGRGSLLIYDGRSPEGHDARARVSVCLIEGYGITFTALGVKKHVEKRKKTVQQMFETFGFAEAEKDPKLVGIWFSESFSSAKAGKSSLNTTTKMTMVLRKDGQFARISRFLASGETQHGTYSIDTGAENFKSDGRWCAKNGSLSLIWNDGDFSEYKYHVQGTPGSRDLLLTWGDGNKELWQDQR